MDRPTSFSQDQLFEDCSRSWLYKYILKIPTFDDMCYAHAGSVIHKCLENYYKGSISNMEDLRKNFEHQWLRYKLPDTKLKLKKDSYWLMVINGINLAKHITTAELKIFFPDVVGYIDIIDTDNDELGDWKSSTRSAENEVSYIKQLKYYCYLYKRKFSRMVNKASVYYLKYSGSKGELSIEPTEQDVLDTEQWHFKQREGMDKVKEEYQKDKTIPVMPDHCFFFCGYKNLCNDNRDCLKYTLHITNSEIQLDGNMTLLLSKGIDKKFSYELKNAYYIKKANPHARTTIKFWNRSKRRLPLGFMEGLLKTLHDYSKFMKKELAIDVQDHRTLDETRVEMPPTFVNGRSLRDYQEDAVTAYMRKKIAILEVGTGGGKTEIAIECIRRTGVRTLFIVDRVELMKQTKKRIEDTLGIKVGQIGQGVMDIQDVTVATVQTLIKGILIYSDYLKTVRFCIFDETHKVAAKSYYSISRQLQNCDYRLGMSGTAFRDDGNDMMINAVVGYKCFDLSSKTLIDNGWLMKPNIRFIKEYMPKEQIELLETLSKEGLVNETPNYSNYYNTFIANNVYRNEAIYNEVIKNKDKKILILVKLVEHGKLLESMIDNSKYLHGETNRKERDSMFKDFVEGKLSVLISTISIFAEGIDVPSLNVVLNAAANRGEVKTIQVLGRVLRKMEGKNDAQYIDFIDETKFFKLASLARKNALLKEGHDVEILKYDIPNEKQYEDLKDKIAKQLTEFGLKGLIMGSREYKIEDGKLVREK